MVRPRSKIISAFLLALIFFTLPVMTFAEDELPDEYGDMMDSVPNDAADSLPDEIFSDELEDIIEGADHLSSWEYVLDLIFDTLGLNLRRTVSTLAGLISLIALCALLNMLKNTLSSQALGRVLSMIGTGVIATAAVELSRDPINSAISLLENIRLLVNSMSPCLTAMYAMGGNVSTAVVHHYGLIVFLSILNNICIISLEAVVGVCLALSIASAFGLGNDLSYLSGVIKKIFTFIIGFLMLVFTTVISAQTLLSAKADTLSAKAAKLLASQMIPLVGSTVGESLRTAGASIEYLRGNVGIIIIAVLAVMILPTLISLFLYRLCFSLANAVSGMLGCEREARLLGEISGIYGYIIAILAICAVALLLLVTVFAKCGSALA